MTTTTTTEIEWVTVATVARLGDVVAYIKGETGKWVLNVYNTATDWDYGERTFKDLSEAKRWAVNFLRYYAPKNPASRL